MAGMTNQTLWLTGDPEADALLSEDDNALLIGMVLGPADALTMKSHYSAPAPRKCSRSSDGRPVRQKHFTARAARLTAPDRAPSRAVHLQVEGT